MAATENPADLTPLTVELLSAYLTNNTVGSDDLPRLIRETRLALSEDAAPEPVIEEEQSSTPAVSIRKSQASSAHLLSLIDGKPYKTLKRHLAANGFTPEAYRERYKLPANYPMVAPDFAAKRRAIAEQIGLGNRPKPAASEIAEKLVAAPAPAANTEPVTDGKPAKTDASAAKSPAAKNASSKSAEPVVKPKRKAARKPAKVHGDASVAAAPAGEPAPPKAKPKPKSSANSGLTDAAATARKRAAGRAAKAEVVSDSIAAPISPTAPAPAPKPVRKPRGKLGLFGKGQPTPGDGATAADGETPSRPTEATQSGKAPTAERMARAPKPTTTDAG
jgi:predicted transcriptional regulator